MTTVWQIIEGVLFIILFLGVVLWILYNQVGRGHKSFLSSVISLIRLLNGKQKNQEPLNIKDDSKIRFCVCAVLIFVNVIAVGIMVISAFFPNNSILLLYSGIAILALSMPITLILPIYMKRKVKK